MRDRAFVIALAAAAATALVPAPAVAVAPQCSGDLISPATRDYVISGEFAASDENRYVLLPFAVPSGNTAVRVKYCHSQPEAPTNAQVKHVLDLGIYDAEGADGFHDEDEFRGWGGSSHPDVTVARNGFAAANGKTTRGFVPGPIPAGDWAVELGIAAVASQLEGDADGKVAWRVEIDVISAAGYADEPYDTTACSSGGACTYSTTPASTAAGWYAGDFHVHAEHSSLGDASMSDTFDYAFGSIASGKAGLDFITLSDYVTDSAWQEIGRFQATYPGKLIMRSAEVITYEGHTNNHGSATYVDYRTGPVYERDATTGALTLARAARSPSAIFDDVHAAGGFTQINHPTIFPSEVPGFSFLCRGCPWDYDDAETDYSKVDAIEVATGPPGLRQGPNPGPNPFTPTAIQFWENAIDSGGLNANKIAAVGSSDSHNAGSTPDPVTQAPVGTATTMVYAEELSEEGIQDAVEAGHTYVKVFGANGPDLRLTATAPGEPEAMMGDTIASNAVTLHARVLGAGPSAVRPGPYALVVWKDGAPLFTTPVHPLDDDFDLHFPSLGPGRYRLQLQRGGLGVAAIETVTSPIYVESP